MIAQFNCVLQWSEVFLEWDQGGNWRLIDRLPMRENQETFTGLFCFVLFSDKACKPTIGE